MKNVDNFNTNWFRLDNKNAIITGGASVAYLKDDLLNIRVAMFLEIFTTIGALIGAVLVGIFKASWLNAFFGFLLLYQGFAMWQKMHSKNKIAKISWPIGT
ncbi:hypothetical protein ATW93_09330 [Oenococcus oeni]|nr:hypothetical protein ATW93_09330 [Oenococcus oeni]